ncbi:hypothetical protein GOC31_27180 [Sinorhizobium meliloti]|nr:hypothetical protein [Sinorhizobium meliloti]MDX0252339.1 hypothetical protein [Sinorhizobium meliloti]
MLKYMIQSALLIISMCHPTSLAAECFNKEYAARIDYELSYDILAPMSGFVEWPPKQGFSYDPIVLNRQADPNSPLRYMIQQNQTDNVVAYVTNEALWARERLARTEESASRRSLNRGQTMSLWQSHMREHEDYLFALQQGQQNAFLRRKIEPLFSIQSRAAEFAKQSTAFALGPDNGISKKHSVDSRLRYSDYMRAFELPQFEANLKLGHDSSILRKFAVEGDDQLGMITCPEQCVVIRSYVRKDQRVNEGDKLATVVSPFHKKITVDVDSKHVLNYVDTSEIKLIVSVVFQTPRYRIHSFKELPSGATEAIPPLIGYFLGPPVLNSDRTLASLQLALRDESGESELRLNPLSPEVRVKIVPEQYVAASAPERLAMETKISALGLSCQ